MARCSAVCTVPDLVAVGRSILIIVWHLLSNDQARFHDLGADYFDKRRGPERIKQSHVRQLEAPGYTVTPRTQGRLTHPGLTALPGCRLPAHLGLSD